MSGDEYASLRHWRMSGESTLVYRLKNGWGDGRDRYGMEEWWRSGVAECGGVGVAEWSG